MATQNQHEQLDLGTDGHPGFERPDPFEAPRPNRTRDPRLARSQTERNVELELLGHQEAFPSLQNIVVASLREQSDRHFLERLDATPANVVELPLPTAADNVIEFPAQPVSPSAA